MSYIEVYPKSIEAYEVLVQEKNKLYALLHDSVQSVFGIPDTDIIIELKQCTTAGFNSQAIKEEVVPDVVVKLSTNDVEFKERASQLCELVVAVWKREFSDAMVMEFWINFFESWGSNSDLG